MSGALSATSLAALNAGLISVATASALPSAGAVLGGAALASSVVGGIGAIQQGNAASAAAGYNAKVAANNAAIATQNANYAGAEGEQNLAATAAKTRAQIGATLAEQGASGVDINSGSSVKVRESEAKLGMLDALNIRSQAVRQAYGFQNQSDSYVAESGLEKSKAKSNQIGGYLNAGSTVLGGIGNASKYTNWLSDGDPTGLN